MRTIYESSLAADEFNLCSSSPLAEKSPAQLISVGEAHSLRRLGGVISLYRHILRTAFLRLFLYRFSTALNGHIHRGVPVSPFTKSKTGCATSRVFFDSCTRCTRVVCRAASSLFG